MNDDKILWVERYRPKTVDACVLPEELKSPFLEYVKQKKVPNLILTGTSGVGKTTVAKAMCEEIGLDYIMINGSEESGIDTLRVKIMGFASSISLMGGQKVVIIDEADNLSPAAQGAFRGVIEQFANNCTFIFTCNHINKLIPAIQSRCAIITFKLHNGQTVKMAQEFLKRVEFILDIEKVSYDRKVVVEVITKFFPDYRRILNELQHYSIGGKVDVGILAQISDAKMVELIGFIKSKNFREIRRWVGSNSNSEAQSIMKNFYDRLWESLKPESIPAAIVLLGKYQFQSAFAADQEINLMSFFTEIMLECEMK